MCPWLTDTEEGNFIPVLTQALRKTVIEVVSKFQV
jgi:hypothetical protein